MTGKMVIIPIDWVVVLWEIGNHQLHPLEILILKRIMLRISNTARYIEPMSSTREHRKKKEIE